MILLTRIHNLLGSKKPGPQGHACPALRGSEINGSAHINQPE
jgi:hypothetical protein